MVELCLPFHSKGGGGVMQLMAKTQISEDEILATGALKTPIGLLRLRADEEGLSSILFPNQKEGVKKGKGNAAAQAHLHDAMTALEEYFAGTRKQFADLCLSARGTDFQKSVWRQLSKIPYGKTCSYAEIAKRIGNPKAMRAVGLANGRNPLPIIVPCHRVIGASGKLVGFGGGLPTKKFLLELEGIITPELL